MPSTSLLLSLNQFWQPYLNSSHTWGRLTDLQGGTPAGGGKTPGIGGQSRGDGGDKEAKDVGEWKGKHREEALHGHTEWNQEIQAGCVQEKAQS